MRQASLSPAPPPTPSSAPSPTARRVQAAAVGLGGAAVLGLLAALLGDRDPLLTGVVFALCTAAPCWGLGWLWRVAPVTAPELRHHEDAVERRWWTEAASGAFVDLVVLLGVVGTALGLTGWDVGAQGLVTAAIVLALADVTARSWVLRRREG